MAYVNRSLNPLRREYSLHRWIRHQIRRLPLQVLQAWSSTPILRCCFDLPLPIYKTPTRSRVVHVSTLSWLDAYTFCVLGPTIFCASWATVINSRSGVGTTFLVDCLSILLSNPAHKNSNIALFVYIQLERRESLTFSTVSNPDWTISGWTTIGNLVNRPPRSWRPLRGGNLSQAILS